LQWQDLELALSYHFEPGHPADGISVSIPVGLLNRVPRYRFEWLVPGLLREKCIALVKGLPKGLRKQLVPVPDFVDRALVAMELADRPLVEVLSAHLPQLSGPPIAVQDWRLDKLDDYYRMNFRIVDADGKLLRQGRDLDELVADSRQQTRESLQGDNDDGPAVTGLTNWTLGDLPETWRTRQAGTDIESYPALVDRGDTVDVVLFDYARQAAVAHRRGLTRLYRLQCGQQVRFLRKQLLRGNDANLIVAAAGMERAPLLEDLIDACFAQALLKEFAAPRTGEEFEQALQLGRGELVNCGNELERLLLNSLSPLAELRQRLAQADDRHASCARQDIEQQLGQLFGPDFQYATPWQWLGNYPRYLKAVVIRLQRLSGQYQKDQQHTETIAGLAQPLEDYLSRAADGLQINPELRQYRWLLEELRVSFFAQSLGTATPVSAKRAQQQWLRVIDWDMQNPI
jgi:ATP-dependent helicase HrpA